MLHVSRWKTIGVVFACLASLLFTLPNFFAKAAVQSWPVGLPRMQLPLGLDFSGGAHLLLAMDSSAVSRDWLHSVRDDARRRLRDAKIAFVGLGIAANTVVMRVAKPEDAELLQRCCKGWSSRRGTCSSGAVLPTLRLRRAKAAR
jgi:preprotein translocase subunit SecD